MISALITDYFKNNINKDTINWHNFSNNPNLTWDIIKIHSDKKWNWSHLSRINIITFDIIKLNINLPWDYESLSRRKNIDFNFVSEFIDKPWNWCEISYRNKIPIGMLIYISTLHRLDWYKLSQTYSDIEIAENIQLDWYWYNIFSLRDKESIHLIFRNIDHLENAILDKIVKSICYDTKNINKIPWHIIMKCEHIRWNWDLLSSRQDLSLECLLKYHKKDWHWKVISKNKAITWDFVSKNKHLPWDYEFLSNNPNITLENINQTPFNNWNYDVFQVNPNFLLSNEDLIKKNHAICIIQRAYKKCYYNPDYLVCRKRLIKEYNNLI